MRSKPQKPPLNSTVREYVCEPSEYRIRAVLSNGQLDIACKHRDKWLLECRFANVAMDAIDTVVAAWCSNITSRARDSFSEFEEQLVCEKLCRARTVAGLTIWIKDGQ